MMKNDVYCENILPTIFEAIGLNLYKPCDAQSLIRSGV
jgi:hypothetical protein